MVQSGDLFQDCSLPPYQVPICYFILDTYHLSPVLQSIMKKNGENENFNEL